MTGSCAVQPLCPFETRYCMHPLKRLFSLLSDCGLYESNTKQMYRACNGVLACYLSCRNLLFYVGGLISFVSTVIFLLDTRQIWIKPVLCSRMVSLFPSYFTLNTQILTVPTQCTSKWKSFHTFGSNSVLLLNL